jgi:hypothetical protein
MFNFIVFFHCRLVRFLVLSVSRVLKGPSLTRMGERRKKQQHQCRWGRSHFLGGVGTCMWELVLVSHSWCCEFSTPLAKAGAEFQTINNGCYLPRRNLFDCPHYECGSCFTGFFCDSHVPTFSIYHSQFKIYHVPSPLCHFTFVSIKWSRFNYLRQMVSVGPFTPYLLLYIYICPSVSIKLSV